MNGDDYRIRNKCRTIPERYRGVAAMDQWRREVEAEVSFKKMHSLIILR